MSMISTEQKTVKHKSTCGPFECEHCGMIWYGSAAGCRYAPGSTLCTKCYLALYSLIEKKYEDFLYSQADEHTDMTMHVIQAEGLAWVQNKSSKPLPYPAEKRFHKSVPKWMRSAIDAELVKPNDTQIYVVYSQGQKAVTVNIIDR